MIRNVWWTHTANCTDGKIVCAQIINILDWETTRERTKKKQRIIYAIHIKNRLGTWNTYVETLSQLNPVATMMMMMERKWIQKKVNAYKGELQQQQQQQQAAAFIVHIRFDMWNNQTSRTQTNAKIVDTKHTGRVREDWLFRENSILRFLQRFFFQNTRRKAEKNA